MQSIYLDNAATTAVRPEVVEIVKEHMTQVYGNPSSLHSAGLAAELAIGQARAQIAKGISCLPEEIIFTSGGTEANNLALLGGVAAHHRGGKTIVTTQVEHASVLAPLAYLEQQGYQVIKVPPRADGTLDLPALLEAVTDDTVLVSAMLVGSETGSISDISAAVTQVKQKNKDTLFHADGVQAFGKIPVSTRQLGVDYLTLSGHKIYAPKGVGALYVKKGVRVLPRTYGGGQEHGLRSGTEAVPLIAGFGLAAQLAVQELTKNTKQMQQLANYFMNKLKNLPDSCSNSPADGTLYIQNLSVLGYRSEILLHYLANKNIYLSSGSACSKGQRSHVLQAMGLSPQRVDSALRVSMSHTTTTQEIDALFAALASAQQEILRSR